VATAPDSTNGERHLSSVAHLVDEAVERIHAAENADNQPQVRRELYHLRDKLNEVLA
jgi:hypothetical protein